MVRAIDADKAMEVAQIKYNDWNLAMAAADDRREINLCFKKQELFKAVKAVLDCVPTLTPPNEWVAVEERLPEKHSEYIVCACDEGEPIDERIWGDTVVVCADYYDGAFTWYEGNTEYDISDIVTHWMSLPEPPDCRPPEGEA